LVYLLQAIVHQKLGEKEKVEELFRAAKRAEMFKKEMGIAEKSAISACNDLKNAVTTKRKKEIFKKIDYVFDLFMDRLPRCVDQELNAVQATKIAGEESIALVESTVKEKKGKVKELRFVKARQVIKEMELDEAKKWLKTLSEKASQNASNLQNVITNKKNRGFKNLIEQIKEEKSNTIRIVGVGMGPFKYRVGEHGELVKFGRLAQTESNYHISIESVGEEEVSISYRNLEDIENVYYQAATRGGREMDCILKDKVVFKYQSQTASEILSSISQILDSVAHSATYQSATGAMAASQVFGVISVAIHAASLAAHPEADIRCWKGLPNKFTINVESLPPGRYEFIVAKEEGVPLFKQQVVINEDKWNVIFAQVP